MQRMQLSSETKSKNQIPLSKTVRKICMPKALLRILKDIEESAVFEDIIHNTKEWKPSGPKNLGSKVGQK